MLHIVTCTVFICTISILYCKIVKIFCSSIMGWPDFKVTASFPMHMRVDINCMASEMCSGGVYNYTSLTLVASYVYIIYS